MKFRIELKNRVHSKMNNIFYSILLAITFWLLPQILFSQNLVYNPGFESDSGAIINDYSQWKAGNTVVDGWYVPTEATSDYYNSHFSTIKGHPIPKARTGQGRVAMIWSNAWQYPYREFLTGKLISPLEKNKKYKVSFYVCRYKYSHYSPLQMGVYFSADSMLQKNYFANIKVEPQVKEENFMLLEDRKYWHKIEGIYLANGGEKYITLGNFKQTINDMTQPSIKISNKFTIVGTRSYAYVFVDDVSVEEYTETEKTTVNKKKLYVYLVDASSSMKKNKKFSEVKSGIKKSIKKLPVGSEYAVITFANKPQTILPPANILLYDLADAMDTVKIEGQTNAGEAIQFTYDFSEINSNYDVELIMCTDGQFKLDDSTYQRVAHSDIRFNLLQIGGHRNMYLENLINATGGKYIVSENKNIVHELKTLSNSVSSDLTEVEYTPSKPGLILVKWTLLLSLVALAVFAI
jgi:hypothetical protein